MPARTDHDRRDAQHAARATIAIHVSRYIRRMTETAYAHIEEEATRDGGDVDWTEVGTAAAHRALAAYGVAATPAAAIDGSALELGAANDADQADA